MSAKKTMSAIGKKVITYTLMLIGTSIGGFVAFIFCMVVITFISGQGNYLPAKAFHVSELALFLSTAFGVIISIIIINKLVHYEGSVGLGMLGSILGGLVSFSGVFLDLDRGKTLFDSNLGPLLLLLVLKKEKMPFFRRTTSLLHFLLSVGYDCIKPDIIVRAVSLYQVKFKD